MTENDSCQDDDELLSIIDNLWIPLYSKTQKIMGTYIEITGEFPCPLCKKPLSGWQSKDLFYDGYPIDILLQQYKLNKKMSGEIHTACNTDGAVAYSYTKGKFTPLKR